MSKTDTEYAEARNHLRTVSSLGVRLSNTASGRTVSEWHLEYASYLFAKICSHATSAGNLAPTGLIPTRPGASELWDLPSVCAIVRALVDAYYALYYIAIEPIKAEERAFREGLWTFQGEDKRLALLKLIQSKSPELTVLQSEVGRLRAKVLAHPLYGTLPTDKQRAIRKGDLPIYLTGSELSERAGISVNYYRAVYRFLSSYVYSYPFSLSQLARLDAGDPESLRLFAVTLRYCLAFLALSVRDFRSLFADLSAVSDPAADEVVDQWVYVACGVAK